MLLVAALCAVGVAACGSSDDSSSSASTVAPTAAGDQASSGAQNGQGAEKEGSAAFREPGGDNSIQNYGEEADPTEREDAETALVVFMAARAKEDWATACRYLGRDAVTPLEEFAKRSPKLQGKDCAQLLTAITGAAPAGTFDNTFKPPVASLRVKGERGFALYHGPHGIDYFMVMAKEGDEWKAAAISPSEFPGSG